MQPIEIYTKQPNTNYNKELKTSTSDSKESWTQHIIKT